MASTNKHAIEISNNTRTRTSKPLSSSLRGNLYNLRGAALRVNSMRCDPRLTELRRDLHTCSVRFSRFNLSAVPRSRSAGHEEEHYADPRGASSQNDPFSGVLRHTRLSWSKRAGHRTDLRWSPARSCLRAASTDSAAPLGATSDVRHDPSVQRHDPPGQIPELRSPQPCVHEPRAQ